MTEEAKPSSSWVVRMSTRTPTSHFDTGIPEYKGLGRIEELDLTIRKR